MGACFSCLQSSTDGYHKMLSKQIDSELSVDREDDSKYHKIFITTTQHSFASNCLNAAPFMDGFRYYNEKKSINNKHGLLEFNFEQNNAAFKALYESFNHCERTKWLHCFDNVSIAVWLCDISMLDQYIFYHHDDDHDDDDVHDDDEKETNRINKLLDDLEHFTEFANAVWFRDSDKVIMFVGTEELKQKIEDGMQISNHFTNYDGNNEMEDILLYIEQLYSDKLNSNDMLYRHFIPRVDDKEFWKKVWDDVIHMAVSRLLSRG